MSRADIITNANLRLYDVTDKPRFLRYLTIKSIDIFETNEHKTAELFLSQYAFEQWLWDFRMGTLELVAIKHAPPDDYASGTIFITFRNCTVLQTWIDGLDCEDIEVPQLCKTIKCDLEINRKALQCH